jgi:signal transduction histidine kinase
MKMPKTRSYIRMVAGFFLLFAAFFIVQSLMLHFRVARNILPFYTRERREVALRIRAEILREAELDPHFDLKNFIAKHNARFTRLRLEFIPASQIRSEKGELVIRNQNKHSREKLIDAIPLNFKINRNNSANGTVSTDGYLILFSNRMRSLSATVNGLSIFMVVTLLPSLIIGFFIFRKAYRRSSILVEAVEKVSRGDYSVRVNLSEDDEFSRIGKAFNEMAASIARSTEELIEMDRQRRQFIADISHELATPLTSLKGYVETLRMEELKLKPEEQQQYLQIVWDESERLSFLVKDLLELARMDAGTIKLERDWIDCAEFMKSFINHNTLSLKQRNVMTEWTVQPGQLIFVDYRRLEQILQNLLDNALKHSVGLRKIRIEFSEDPENTMVAISDDGGGIPAEYIDDIFKRFYKINGELATGGLKQYSGDIGLGLSIVKGLVELHGGRITVKSAPGEGTTFIMEVPRITHSQMNAGIWKGEARG